MASWRRPPRRPRNVWLNKFRRMLTPYRSLSTLRRSEIARGQGAAQRSTRTTQQWWGLVLGSVISAARSSIKQIAQTRITVLLLLLVVVVVVVPLLLPLVVPVVVVVVVAATVLVAKMLVLLSLLVVLVTDHSHSLDTNGKLQRKTNLSPTPPVTTKKKTISITAAINVNPHLMNTYHW